MAENLRNILISLSYDGTNYFGWQRQPNKRTIQGELEGVLKKILNEDINVVGSGRTDRGVHALGQTANFKIKSKINILKLQKAMNANLPEDIRVINIEEKDLNFSARYSVKTKVYRYQIYNDKVQSPFYNKYSLFYPFELDIKFIKKTLKYLVGQHDFTSFCSIKDENKTKVRTLQKIKVYRKDKLINIEFWGNGFLYNMIRIIIGTVLNLYRNNKKPVEMKKILELKDRDYAGDTVQAKGLFLVKVIY